MLVIGIFGIAVVMIAMGFKTIKPEYSTLISVTGCIFIFIFSLSRIGDIIVMIEKVSSLTAISRGYIKILLKITGIAFVSEISSDISRDCGYTAVANQIIIFGKLSILVMSLPVFVELISSIGNLLS